MEAVSDASDSAAVGATLPDESTARLLEREFPSPDLSYLLLTYRAGA